MPVLHIYHSQDAEVYKATIREDKLYLKNEKVAQFSNSGIIAIKGIKLAKRSKIKCVLYLDGKAEAIKLTDKQKEATIKLAEKNPDNLQVLPETKETIFEALTDKDRITIVRREMAKALGKFKPMETWQFIVIIAMLGALIAIQFIK